ncbi:hypothetical protein LINGRAHAP2_LOCUS28131, partial [Linum grandiflorum]
PIRRLAVRRTVLPLHLLGFEPLISLLTVTPSSSTELQKMKQAFWDQRPKARVLMMFFQRVDIAISSKVLNFGSVLTLL